MKDIIPGIISFAGVFISSLVAWFVSRSTANKELEKLRLTWKREDIVSSDDEFAELASAVARFLRSDTPHNFTDASAKSAALRAKESGSLGACLDRLYISISDRNKQEIERALTAVIEEKRQAKCKAAASCPDSPD